MELDEADQCNNVINFEHHIGYQKVAWCLLKHGLKPLPGGSEEAHQSASIQTTCDLSKNRRCQAECLS